MSEYVSLDQQIKEDQNSLAFWILFGKAGTERVESLSKMFLHSAREWFNDDGALYLFKLLVKSVDDLFLLPLAKYDEKTEKFNLPDPWSNQQVKEAQIKATLGRANKAMSLFPLLPVFKPVKCFTWEDDDRNVSRDYIKKEQTLPKTKEVLFLEIANGWKAAKEEIEADSFFEFILKAELHKEDEPLREAVIRKITDAEFPVSRLVHVLSCQKLLKYRDDTVRVLAHGWAKHSSIGQILDVFLAIKQ